MGKKSKRSARFLCTACGDELNEFAFDPRADNMKVLVQGFATCRETGKLAGLYCSKMYIAGGDEAAIPRSSKKAPARTISALKAAILTQLAAEDKTAAKPRRSKSRRPKKG